MTTSFPIKGDADKKIGAFFAPLQVSAQDTPNNTVKIRAGSFFNSQNQLVEFSGGISGVLTPPASLAKWVVVGLTDAGIVNVLDGSLSNTPSLPTIPQGTLPLAAVYLVPTAVKITNNMIFDIRPFMRSIGDIPEIIGQTVNPTLTQMNNELATKADTDGTPSATFTLNADSTANNNASLVVHRVGNQDVSIRWNTTDDRWELTNDGVTFAPINSNATFANAVHTHVAADITDLSTLLNTKVNTTDLTTALALKADVSSVTSGLALKADIGTVSAHTTSIGTLQTGLTTTNTALTTLTTTVDGKLNLTGGTLTGNLTVHTIGNLPITLNSLSATSSGLSVDRPGIHPDAFFGWDETLGKWVAGTVGNVGDILLTDTEFGGKADRVIKVGINGNLAGLDTNGNLTDSTFKPSDLALAVHTHVVADILDFNTTVNTMLIGKVDETLTIGTGQGLLVNGLTSSDLKQGVTITLTNTGVAAGVYGDGTNIPVVTVDAQGRITDVDTMPVSATGFVTTTALTTGLAGKANTSTTIAAGNGLTGGGSLAGNRSIDVASFKGTATLDFAAVGATSSLSLPIAVIGAVIGDPVVLGYDINIPGIVFTANVTAADTVSVTATNITATPIDPVSATFNVIVFTYSEF